MIRLKLRIIGDHRCSYSKGYAVACGMPAKEVFQKSFFGIFQRDADNPGLREVAQEKLRDGRKIGNLRDVEEGSANSCTNSLKKQKLK